MNKRNVELSLEKAKDWYQQGGELKEVALQAFTEDELKEIARPRSWQEFCNNFLIKEEECYIDTSSHIFSLKPTSLCARNYCCDRNLCVSIEEAQAFRALMQLRQLRKAWVGEWEPDWEDDVHFKWCIKADGSGYSISTRLCEHNVLSFPTREMGEQFLHDFIDLIKQATPLL